MPGVRVLTLTAIGGVLQFSRFNGSLGRLKMAWFPVRMFIGRAQTRGLFLVGSGLLPLARSVRRLLPPCSAVLVLRLMVLSVRELSARCKVYLGTPVDGVVSEGAAMVMALQQRLNEGRF